MLRKIFVWKASLRIGIMINEVGQNLRFGFFEFVFFFFFLRCLCWQWFLYCHFQRLYKASSSLSISKSGKCLHLNLEERCLVCWAFQVYQISSLYFSFQFNQSLRTVLLDNHLKSEYHKTDLWPAYISSHIAANTRDFRGLYKVQDVKGFVCSFAWRPHDSKAFLWMMQRIKFAIGATSLIWKQGRGVHVTGVSAAYTFQLNKNILSE
jgi:hypothetical protein